MKTKVYGRIPVLLLMILMAFLFSLPLLWALSTSLKPLNQIYVDPPELIPNPVMFQNYPETFALAPFGRYAYNTLMITVLTGIGRVALSSIIAFGFARFDFPGKNLFFTLLLATMMIPHQVLLVPQFLLFNALGWVNTFLPLIIPAYFGGAAFMIFLGRQFIRSIPIELDEAAEIDGCSPMAILIRIILPPLKPFLATATILSFQHDWNAFLGPLVYLQNQSKYTLSLGLRYLAALGGGESMAGKPVEHYIMAATIMMALPVILIFLVFQRYFVKGVVMSGIKG